MSTYQVVALPEELASEVRATLKAPRYGHPAHIEVATGYGPCRSCLRTFEEGTDERILFTFDPFQGLDRYPAPGPVFIHREACSRYDAQGFPPGLKDLPLTLEAYGKGRWLVTREPVTDGDADSTIARLFAHPVVEYIHVRNTEAGCYIARVERAGGA
ncbi:MAG TPA: DUF1203 domain-containing protein [Thermoanaerobaculia bacterium]|nr:DUF1203 domain-containing protein [Thermoanaerobaculia bacterium]